MKVLSFVLARLALTPLIILGLVTLVFFIVRITPVRALRCLSLGYQHALWWL